MLTQATLIKFSAPLYLHTKGMERGGDLLGRTGLGGGGGECHKIMEGLGVINVCSVYL